MIPKWLKDHAKKKKAWAALMLANSYHNGTHGFSTDNRKAFQLYHQAAEQKMRKQCTYCHITTNMASMVWRNRIHGPTKEAADLGHAEAQLMFAMDCMDDGDIKRQWSTTHLLQARNTYLPRCN